MVKKHEFIERIIYLIREQLEDKLPVEDTLDEMAVKAKTVIENIL